MILSHGERHDEADVIVRVSPPFRAVEETPVKESKVSAMIVTGDRDRLADSTQLDAELASFTNAIEF